MTNLIRDAIEYMEDLFWSDAGSHDASHTMRVYQNTLLIAATEPECDVQKAALAALLHDVDDYKLFSTSDNANARAFLARQQMTQEEADEICAIINSVSFSKNKGRRPDTIEGKVVQDADRLDAMGAVGIARTFAYGGEHGRPLSDSLEHFDEKLLQLNDLMNTERARQMAARRHAFLEEFLAEYHAETGENDGQG